MRRKLKSTGSSCTEFSAARKEAPDSAAPRGNRPVPQLSQVAVLTWDRKLAARENGEHKTLQIRANPCTSLHIRANPHIFEHAHTLRMPFSLEMFSNPCKSLQFLRIDHTSLQVLHGSARKTYESLQIIAHNFESLQIITDPCNSLHFLICAHSAHTF